MLLRLLLIIIFAVYAYTLLYPPSPPSAPAPPLPSLPHSPSLISAPGRLFSLPDLHGDYTGACLLLRKLGVMGEDSKWTGGNAVVVQTGDVVDRGDGSSKILRLFHALDGQARREGGRMVVLLGNHELLNLQNKFWYATPGETRGFGGTDESRAFAFSKNGEFGEYIRSFPTALVVRQAVGAESSATLFVHGGLMPQFLTMYKTRGGSAVQNLNDYVKTLLDRNDLPESQDLVFSEDGPFWNRYLAMGKDEAKVCSALMQTLELSGADKVVVGHTVQQGGVAGTRCGSRLILGDVGFAPYYYGSRSGLEHFANGEIKEWRAV